MSNTGKQMSTDIRQINGYAGKILRVDLNSGQITSQQLDESMLREYIGGAALGIKFLYDEVSPKIEWSDPENSLFFFSGPLGGTKVGGSGAIAVVTKGALTNGVASSQANGYFGAYLRFAGFDGIAIRGSAKKWVYLYIHDGTVELKDAVHLVGKDTFEVDHVLKQELQKEKISVLSIGQGGENMVRFASIFTDMGHMAAHNGVGAVMGSKKLKAIVIERGNGVIPLHDKEAFSQVAKEIRANTSADMFYKTISIEGTLTAVVLGSKVGFLPVKNYTTNVHTISPDKLNAYSPQNIRLKFKAKPNPCWACASKHCHMSEVTEGKYAHRMLEEPEYEGLAAFSALVGIDDVTESVVLANEVDRLGFDTNEAGWVIAWVMECYEKGILTKKDTDGLEMTWGNCEAILVLLKNIASRQGFGNILAEGVMRASRRIGGEASKLAVYTLKSNTPRSHDHRVMWLELFDTCVSNTGTLETQSKAPFKSLNLPEKYDGFDPATVSTVEAKIKGAMIFEDSMVTCRFQTATAIDLLCRAINAATGWNLNFDEAMKVGRRAVNLARAYNLLAGIGGELDAPSIRYGSTLHDGVAAGKGIMPHWHEMLCNYYKLMGWDESTGKPLPATLQELGLNYVIPRLWT
jgi:aldehyde:ferredoxin oxidoreductase